MSEMTLGDYSSKERFEKLQALGVEAEIKYLKAKAPYERMVEVIAKPKNDLEYYAVIGIARG
jgi:hypothetical protein